MKSSYAYAVIIQAAFHYASPRARPLTFVFTEHIIYSRALLYRVMTGWMFLTDRESLKRLRIVYNTSLHLGGRRDSSTSLVSHRRFKSPLCFKTICTSCAPVFLVWDHQTIERWMTAKLPGNDANACAHLLPTSLFEIKGGWGSGILLDLHRINESHQSGMCIYVPRIAGCVSLPPPSAWNRDLWEVT